MTTQLRGISSQYPGKCEHCGGQYAVGDLVDKLASGKRGHAQCAANERAGRPPQSQPGAAATAPAQSASPAANGHAPASSGVVVSSDAIAALWRLRTACTTIAQGAMAAAVAIEEIARSVDPHQAHATHKDAAA